MNSKSWTDKDVQGNVSGKEFWLRCVKDLSLNSKSWKDREVQGNVSGKEFWLRCVKDLSLNSKSWKDKDVQGNVSGKGLRCVKDLFTRIQSHQRSVSRERFLSDLKYKRPFTEF